MKALGKFKLPSSEESTRALQKLAKNYYVVLSIDPVTSPGAMWKISQIMNLPDTAFPEEPFELFQHIRIEHSSRVLDISYILVAAGSLCVCTI